MDKININNPTPEIGPYTKLTPFRFWCQKVLPLVYDESLSYYELLCKVVDYLNKTMEDVDNMIDDMGEFRDAYTDFTGQVKDAVEGLESFVNNYFENLDVQEEINNKLDAMAEAGYFSTLFTTLFTDDIITEAGNVTSAWIVANLLQETGYVIDASLTVANAAADAKSVGDALNQRIKYSEGILPVYPSINLLNKYELEEGYWYNTSGVKTPITDENPFATSPLIPVNENTKYTTIGIQSIAYFDSNKQFISFENTASVYYLQHITPANTAYVGLNTRKAWYNIAVYCKGIYNGPYISGEGKLSIEQTQGLPDLLNEKLDYIVGKNLFDKSGNKTPITTGFYRAYGYGSWEANADFEVATFKVTGGENYVVNTWNTHICFFSDENATHYLSGFLVSVANGKTFTVPANAKTMSASFAISAANTFQIEHGTTETAYEAFKYGIDVSHVFGATLHVGQAREFSTIQSAINAASNGDTILIDAGTYVESLDMVGKYLHLIGTGRDSTIVTYSGDDYYYPPLEASKGLIENLSFITTATEKAEGAIDTAYCVHIDYDDEINSALQFVNCYFESPIRPTVGIGLRENFTLNFTNCKFKSSVYPVYCHEQQANNKTGQRIELVDCSIQSTGATSAIHLQESRAYSGNEVTILMQRCIAKANGVSGNNIISAVTYPNNETPTGSNYLNLNSFYLDKMSALNNENILNY